MARSQVVAAAFVVMVTAAVPALASPLIIGSLEWVGCERGARVFGSGLIDPSTCASDPGPNGDDSYTYYELTNQTDAAYSLGTAVDFVNVVVTVDAAGDGFDGADDVAQALPDVDLSGTSGFIAFGSPLLGSRMTVSFALPGLAGTYSFPVLRGGPGRGRNRRRRPDLWGDHVRS